MMASVKPVQGVVIHITQNFKGIKVSLPGLRKLVKTICSRFSENDIRNAGSGKTKYEINIAIVEDAEFRDLNKRFLNRKTTSDCLSFDLSDDREPDSSKLLEIVVNGELAVKQANLFGHSDEAELALYVTHGLLHQLGFDDSTPRQSRKMHNIEDEILQKLGYGLVYNKSIKTQERRKVKK
jgi:probable rRNA maturation factor